MPFQNPEERNRWLPRNLSIHNRLGSTQPLDAGLLSSRSRSSFGEQCGEIQQLEAEAAAAKAAQRHQDAGADEKETAEAEASGDEQASKRAYEAHKLAMEKPEAVGLEPPYITADGGSDPLAMPQRQPPTDATGNPKSHGQSNFSDLGSHIHRGADCGLQGYNVQAAVDGDHQLIVAIDVSNQPNDALYLLPIQERIRGYTGQLPAALTKNAGLLQHRQPGSLQAARYRCLCLHQPAATMPTADTIAGRPPRELYVKRRMDLKLRSKAGQAIYAPRNPVVETVFGQIKSSVGLNGFRLRDLDQVNGS
jgi:hypothetical protein